MENIIYICESKVNAYYVLAGSIITSIASESIWNNNDIISIFIENKLFLDEPLDKMVQDRIKSQLKNYDNNIKEKIIKYISNYDGTEGYVALRISHCCSFVIECRL